MGHGLGGDSGTIGSFNKQVNFVEVVLLDFLPYENSDCYQIHFLKKKNCSARTCLANSLRWKTESKVRGTQGVDLVMGTSDVWCSGTRSHRFLIVLGGGGLGSSARGRNRRLPRRSVGSRRTRDLIECTNEREIPEMTLSPHGILQRLGTRSTKQGCDFAVPSTYLGNAVGPSWVWRALCWGGSAPRHS